MKYSLRDINKSVASWFGLASLLLLLGPCPGLAAPFAVPMMQGQDPEVEFKDGLFNLVQSDGCNIHLRTSATMGGLVTAPDQIILSPGCSNVWAPEIHWLDNKWYVYYSLGLDTTPANAHKNCVAVSQTTNAAGPYSIVGPLYTNFWNIDGSVFTATNGVLYFVFSGNPSGSAQNIYIAPMSNPYTLSGPPVAISQPTLTWETHGAPPAVNEGPFGFTHNGQTFIDYSASGCWTDFYCLGLLQLTGTNLLDPNSWTKSGPVFKLQAGAYGPGHNGIFTDGNGQWWNIYHANDLSGQGCGGYRQLRIQRLYWNATNQPVYGCPVPIGSWISDGTNFLDAEFPLTETSDTTVINQAGIPGGTLNGSPVWVNPGLKFNGLTDYVNCGTATANDVQNEITLAAWIRADSFTDWAGLITKGTNTEPYAMQVLHDGSLRFAANRGSPAGGIGSGSWNSDFKMTPNQWYHVAVTYDGAKVRFYLNGQLDSNQPAAALQFGVANQPLILGADFPGPVTYFQGTMRDARVYGRALGAAEVQSLAQAEFNATIDPGFVVVTNFEGWGTSLCWWANVCGGYATRSTYASIAFNTLGLNIVRYNIGGGENPNIPNTMQYRAQMQGFEPTNGVWNWNADANQRWMLKQALSMGANRVVAFANSPPWWMTVSGSVTGSTNGSSDNLQTGYEIDFANYLTTVVSNLTALDGVHFDYVTPMNEPTANWWVLGGSQEGCHMDANQQARMVTDLSSTLASQNLATGIDASEDNDEQSTIDSINTYGATQSKIALMASHSYSANNPTGLKNLAAGVQKPLWVSEYGDGDATGITMARRIHDDIAGAWVRAWVYWQVVDNAGGWGFLYNSLDGSSETYTVNEKFYVMAQFSQYIRPGSQIFNVDDNNSLAAYNPTNQTLVIVAVNDSTNTLTVNYDLGKFSSLPPQAQGMQTSPSQNLSPIPPISVQNNYFTASLVPQSVTTYILTNTIPAPPGSAPLEWYQFEGNTLDASGNGNNGINFGATYVPGKLGTYAAAFNGSTSYVQIPLVISNHFTIAFWLKTTDLAGSGQWWAGQGLVDGEVQGTTNDFGVTLDGSQVALGIGNPDTTIITTNSVNDGQWHHIAATRDAVSGQMLIYVDGLLQAGGYGPLGTRNAPLSLRIGSIQAGYAGGFLNGAIDDVQIFNRVIPPSAIPQLMNHPPSITSQAANYDVFAGHTLTFSNSATDPDLPAQTLTWSLLAPRAGATINPSNGVFNWRPAMAQAPSVNILTLQVADNGTPVMTATQSFSVSVTLPPAPSLSINASNQVLSLIADGDGGPDYILETATNLNFATSWVPIMTNLSAVPPINWTVVPNTEAEQFYRVTLGP